MDFLKDVSALSGSPDVNDVLEQMCRLTDMGFAAVARVTDQRWIACQVLDKVAFGLEPGSELEIQATICNEIRQSREPVYIDHVAEAPIWATHPVPLLNGFQSYVSVPLLRADGSFYGTLCAIDPEPHIVDTPTMRRAIELLADRMTAVLTRENL